MYAIEVTPSAAKDLRKLPKPAQVKIGEKIDALAKVPRPSGCKKLNPGVGETVGEIVGHNASPRWPGPQHNPTLYLA